MGNNSESTPSPQDSNTGCWLFMIIIVVILALSYCGKKDESYDTVTNFVDAPPTSVSVEPVIEELSPDDVRTGFSHFASVGLASVTGGAQIYSTNCYAGVAKTFKWSMLDRCGGFDLAAVRMTERDSNYFEESELSYFESETSAGRYIAAAAKGSLVSEAADLRFAELQAMSKKMSLPKKAVAISVPDQAEELAVDEPVTDQGTTDGNVIAD